MANYYTWMASKRPRKEWIAKEIDLGTEKMPFGRISINEDGFQRKGQTVRTPQRVWEETSLPKTPSKSKNYKIDDARYKIFREKLDSGRAPSGVETRKFFDTPILHDLNEVNGFQTFSYKEMKYDRRKIHTRAQQYVANIKPDPNFYDIENGRKIYFATKMCSKQFHQTQPENGGRDKRKRKSYNNIDCYVSHYNKLPDEPECPLPEGTKLMKPPNKLVELVAKEIFESPDGMLQVQQLYTAIQNRYPYFRFMISCAINSWKSSIRHALYQKWFSKVKIMTGIHTESKGCYWALNTKYSPREWQMPGQRYQLQATTSIDTNEETYLHNNIPDETTDAITAIDLSMKRNASKESIPEMQLPHQVTSKAKRRLEMSPDNKSTNVQFEGANDDLFGVSPLPPDATYNSIPLMAYSWQLLKDKPVFFYPGNLEMMQQFVANQMPPYVIWDGNTPHGHYNVINNNRL